MGIRKTSESHKTEKNRKIRDDGHQSLNDFKKEFRKDKA